MMQASSVTIPSLSGKPPKPTVVIDGSDSVTRTPFSTASKAVPPLDKIFHAAWLASTPCSQVETTIGPDELKFDCGEFKLPAELAQRLSTKADAELIAAIRIKSLLDFTKFIFYESKKKY